MSARADSDGLWHLHGQQNNWILPPKAPLILRLPVIRQLRAVWHEGQVDRHNQFWRSVGTIPTGYDEWVLYAIWRGWC